MDKAVATAARWRTQESTLHMIVGVLAPRRGSGRRFDEQLGSLYRVSLLISFPVSVIAADRLDLLVPVDAALADKIREYNGNAIERQIFFTRRQACLPLADIR